MAYVPTIAVDFDGVIHSYTSGWKGAHIIPDPPVEGAIEFLSYLTMDGGPVRGVIFSSRAKTWRGRRAMRAWLREHSGTIWHEAIGSHGIESIPITATKPAASVYLDDRGVRFEGSFPQTREEFKALVALAPWNKQ